MLRLNVCCSLVPRTRNVTLGRGRHSWISRYREAGKPLIGVSVRALKNESNGGTSSSPGQSWDPGLEFEVPYEQRPVNEYSSLKDAALYSWGELGPGPFFLRLGGLWLVTFTVLGVPIASASFNPTRNGLVKIWSPHILQQMWNECLRSYSKATHLHIRFFSLAVTSPVDIPILQEPLRFALAAGTGTLFLVSLIVLRIYLGWSYVGDRLLSAVIPYEESGWYDGQIWVKPPEILARDRLLGSHKVKPVIKMLKQTLVRTGVVLVTAVLLFTFSTPVEDFFQTNFAMKKISSNNPSADISMKYNIRKEELLRLPLEVKADDDLAEAAAKAADGRPVYCRDRFYRALAGGQYCKWEDLLN